MLPQEDFDHRVASEAILDYFRYKGAQLIPLDNHLTNCLAMILMRLLVYGRERLEESRLKLTCTGEIIEFIYCRSCMYFL